MGESSSRKLLRQERERERERENISSPTDSQPRLLQPVGPGHPVDPAALQFLEAYRQEHQPLLGLELAEEKRAVFASWDGKALADHLLAFGTLSPNGYLTLSPDTYGPFAAPSSTGVKPPSLPGSAEINLGTHRITRTPNQDGTFPTVYLSTETEVTVSLTLPKLPPGTTIHFGLPGSGTIDGAKKKLSSDHLLTFTFRTNTDQGSYPVELYAKGHRLTFDFYVGLIGTHLSQLVPQGSAGFPPASQPKPASN